ncbi:hypothetical protein [Winogradskyella aquimaris]|uniref:Uncharacterized protein n=1 Tax=Winogradskyella aquimaris TaxID=864074 RepID=A0ABU5EK86_9FLAO|nr:hypothetical protein [Winogradskyella aquimaris]MDY2586791.1 hypothetical protein [Winogradskyella aquimaris]
MNSLQRLRSRLLKSKTETFHKTTKRELSPKAKDATKTVKEDDAYLFI